MVAGLGRSISSTFVIAIIALTVPALALGAAEGKYKGGVVGDSGKVNFKVDGNKVKKFEIDGVYANCYGGNMLISVFVPSSRIQNNKFSETYIPDQESDFQVTLEGKFNGSKASGTVVGEGVCGYEEEWAAKKS